MNEPLAEMLRQNLWANLRLLDACAGLTDEQLQATVTGTRGTIRDTLWHILSGEGRYVGILTGQVPAEAVTGAPPFPSFKALKASAEATGRAAIAFAQSLTEERLLNRALGGRPYLGPASVILIQTFNHGTEHRSQINTILTQLGVEPVSLDGWTYAQATGKLAPS